MQNQWQPWKSMKDYTVIYHLKDTTVSHVCLCVRDMHVCLYVNRCTWVLVYFHMCVPACGN